MEDVPYVVGLDKWIGTELTDECKAYLKDFGAATASNGAVGLYHIDGVTPEAKEQGEALLAKGNKEYVIDDAELERVYRSYPVMWKNPDREGTLAFIGCPHLSRVQLEDWADRIVSASVTYAVTNAPVAETYLYDGNGAMTNAVSDGESVLDIVYDAIDAGVDAVLLDGVRFPGESGLNYAYFGVDLTATKNEILKQFTDRVYAAAITTETDVIIAFDGMAILSGEDEIYGGSPLGRRALPVTDFRRFWISRRSSA